MNEKQLEQAFIQFLAKKSGAKNEKELQQYIQSLGEEGLKQAQNEFMQMIQKAEHGTKLQYLKKLKHICNDDEELVYYKVGGKVDCGCKKKEGGEIKKAESGWKTNFNNRKNKKEPDQATKDSLAVNKYGAEDIESTRPGSYKKNKEGKIQWTPDRTKAPYNKKEKKEKGGEVKLKKKCNGGAVAKFKYRKLGGLL